MKKKLYIDAWDIIALAMHERDTLNTKHHKKAVKMLAEGVELWKTQQQICPCCGQLRKQ